MTSAATSTLNTAHMPAFAKKRRYKGLNYENTYSQNQREHKLFTHSISGRLVTFGWHACACNGTALRVKQIFHRITIYKFIFYHTETESTFFESSSGSVRFGVTAINVQMMLSRKSNSNSNSHTQHSYLHCHVILPKHTRRFLCLLNSPSLLSIFYSLFSVLSIH